MSDSTCLASDPVAIALSWISSRGVEMRPSTSAVALGRAAADHPVLHLLDPGVEPPPCSELEDWIRVPIDLDELHSRANRLLARARHMGASLVRVDEAGTLRVGDRIIVLSLQEASLMAVLIEHLGEVVLRDDITEAIWPDGPPHDPRALDNRVKTLRQRIRGVPLRIHTVRGRGLLLERMVA